MDNNFEQEYRKAMDEVRASDALRNNVLNQKPHIRAVTPFKATLATVAAAVMIVIVAHDYAFKPDPDGVISETVVSTESSPMPQTEFSAVVAETEIPKTVSVTHKPQSTVNSETKAEETQSTAVAEAKPQSLSDTEESAGVPMMTRNGGEANGVAETWEINKYFEYISANPHNMISAVIPVEYTGEKTLEFVVDDTGDPIDDVVTLNYASADGSISVTVSKKSIFDVNLSGTVNTADNGFIAYKVSGDVYYRIFCDGLSLDEITAIVNNF